MKKINKAIAAIIAAVSTTALASSIAPAFAYEDIVAKQEAFVNSFDEGMPQKCAQYLLDNGCTLEEAKWHMDIYTAYDTSNNSGAAAYSSVPFYYYNTTQLAATEHFVLLIATSPKTEIPLVNLEIIGKLNASTTTDSSVSMFNSYSSNVQNFIPTYSKDKTKWYQTIIMSNISAFSESEARPVLKVQVYPTNSITNESQLRNSVDLNVIRPEEYAFAIETYAKGDVDHNGVVNGYDYNLLLKFMAEEDVLNITYADGSNHYSFVTNKAAADFNLDGIVSMADLTALGQYVH